MRTAPIALISLFLTTSAARAADVIPAFPSLPIFDSPINIEDPGDGTDRLFVVERDGRIYVFANNPSVSQRSLFLDIRTQVNLAGECGLLGLAFHPNYENNRYFYICYVTVLPFETVIARVTTNAANPNLADPSSLLPILRIGQSSNYHKGGCVAFGPDGYLYISLGEDTNAPNSQNLTSLKGKVLRIDVDNPGGGLQYGIPPDNPFAGNGSGYREEIYAFGFRNPWRFGFDMDTGKLWLGDVGQNTWEEVDVLRKGRNFGWPRMEGKVCYPIGSPCDTIGLNAVIPIAVYDHGAGSASITGGRVYRGPSVPSLYGRYLYADYIDGSIRSFDVDQNPAVPSVVKDTNLNIVAFGEDANRELYLAAFDGVIYRFEETATAVTARPPTVGSLGVARPNPFRTSATLVYTLPAMGRVRLDVFDVRGAHVATLADQLTPRGDHTVAWNGRDANGRAQPSGIYFCRLVVDGAPAGTQRIVLVK